MNPLGSLQTTHCPQSTSLSSAIRENSSALQFHSNAADELLADHWELNGEFLGVGYQWPEAVRIEHQVVGVTELAP